MQELFVKALERHQTGDLDAAASYCHQILEQLPEQPETLHLLGIIRHQKGAGSEAEALILRAVASDGNNPEFLSNLGLILDQNGKPEKAEDACRKAAVLDPNDPGIFNNLGMALESQNKLSEAEDAYGQALKFAPDYLEAMINLGNVRREMGRFEEAAETYGAAIKLNPNYAECHLNLGGVYKEMSRLDEAVGCFRRALEINPKYAKAHFNLAVALELADRLENAEYHCREATAANPNYYDAFVCLGLVLQQVGRFEEAIAACERAVQIDPSRSDAYNQLGNVQQVSGRFDEADENFRRATAHNPGFAGAHFSRALMLLSQGRFQEGLSKYEWRLSRDTENQIKAKNMSLPRWDGGHLPHGRLFIWGEQGVGDQILYGGLLPSLIARGIRFAFEVDPRLQSLFAPAMPQVEMVPLVDKVGSSGVPPDMAAQIPIASLMGALKPWPRGFSPQSRYLVPDESRVQAMQRILSTLGPHLKIGISWRSHRQRTGLSKSMPIEFWDPIFASREAVFINLQYGETDEETELARARTETKIYTDPDLDRFDDIEGMAALIDCLDLVITTSNVTAHIAGALGKPCWLLLQKVPIWYWGLSGPDVLFYPSIRAYRQETPGEWHPVAETVAGDLSQWRTDQVAIGLVQQ